MSDNFELVAQVKDHYHIKRKGTPNYVGSVLRNITTKVWSAKFVVHLDIAELEEIIGEMKKL